MKKNTVRYLANIVRALRSGCEAHKMFASFNSAFMQSDTKGQYRSSQYDIRGMEANSSPLALMCHMETMWASHSNVFRGMLFGFGLMVALLNGFLFSELAQALCSFFGKGDSAQLLGVMLGKFVTGVTFAGFLFTPYSHDRFIRKMVASYGTMLSDFCESLVVADVRAVWIGGMGWTINHPSIEDVRTRAVAYLNSWALWVTYNEFVNQNSEEAAAARIIFKRYHEALERIGLVEGGFGPFYQRAKDIFEENHVHRNVMVGFKPMVTPPNKPELRVMPRKVSMY